MTINGVELRYGRTFVGRVLPTRSVGAAGRFTTMACVSVDTSSAIVAAIEPGFAENARRSKRNNREFYSALTQLEQKRHCPGWSPAQAAVDIAGLVLLRRDALDAMLTPALIVQKFELWNVEIGELSTTTADINSGW